MSQVNKSKTYILPFINEYIPLKFFKDIINTYLFYEDSYKFCIKYKFSGKKEFTDFERELERNPLYYKTIDINKNEVVYIFHIPIELMDIIDLFLEGKYSYIPRKEVINEFFINKFNLPLNNKISKILNRDEDLRQELEEQLNVTIPEGLDLSSPPIIEDEIFKIDK